LAYIDMNGDGGGDRSGVKHQHEHFRRAARLASRQAPIAGHRRGGPAPVVMDDLATTSEREAGPIERARATKTEWRRS
jgi:hypothetical protein